MTILGYNNLGSKMSDTITFNRRAFNKGVNDTLTLKPLRVVILDLANGKLKSHTNSAKSRYKAQFQKNGERSVTKKVG